MGYYMRSVYRGDYYGQQGRGDYYRPRVGDPGFFDFISDVGSAIGGVVGGIGKTIAPFLPGPIGGIVGGVSRLLSPGTPIANPPFMAALPPIWAATAPGTGSTAAMIPSSPFGPGGRPPNLLAPPMPGGSPAGFSGLSIGGERGIRVGTSGGTSGGGVQLVQDHTGRYHVAACPTRGGATPTRTAFRRVDSWEVKCHKRMNPLNPHALRKALRRAHGFTRLVSKTLRFTKPHHKVGGFKKIGGRKKK